MKSKWLGAGTKVQDRVKSARTSRPSPKAPPSTPPAAQQRPKSARTSIPQRVAVLIEQLSGVERAVELAEEERAKLEFLEARAAAQANASGEGSDGARTELARLRVLAVDGSAHSRQMKAQRDEEMNRRDGDKELHERARELRRQKLGERKRQHKDAKWVAQRMQPPELRPPVPDGSAHAERSPTGATPRRRRPSAEKNELAIRVMQMGHVLEASELALLRGAPPLRRPSLAPSEPESTLIDDHAARLEALGIALTPEEALAEVRRRLDARAEAEALVNDADANLQRRATEAAALRSHLRLLKDPRAARRASSYLVGEGPQSGPKTAATAAAIARAAADAAAAAGLGGRLRRRDDSDDDGGDDDDGAAVAPQQPETEADWVMEAVAVAEVHEEAADAEEAARRGTRTVASLLTRQEGRHERSRARLMRRCTLLRDAIGGLNHLSELIRVPQHEQPPPPGGDLFGVSEGGGGLSADELRQLGWTYLAEPDYVRAVLKRPRHLPSNSGIGGGAKLSPAHRLAPPSPPPPALPLAVRPPSMVERRSTLVAAGAAGSGAAAAAAAAGGGGGDFIEPVGREQLKLEAKQRAQGLLDLNEQPTGRRTALTSRMSFNARRTFAANAAGVSENEAGAAMLKAATAPRSRSASKT